MISPLYAPIATLVALTIVIWAMALARRVGEIRKRRIPPQSMARAKDTASLLQDSQAMDNFNNLLQAPILFYVLCLALAQTGENATFYIAGAWLYVLMRVLHSAIQVTYNKVMHRFYVWVLGNLVLFALWGAFALDIFRGSA